MAGIPTLLTPTNTQTGVSSPVSFTWNAVSGATKYHIQVALENTFASPVHNDNNVTTNSDSVALDPSTEYFWRVRSDVIT